MSDPARFLKYMAKAAREVSVRECVCAGVSVRVCVDTRVWGRQAGCRQSLLQEVAKWHLGFFYFL